MLILCRNYEFYHETNESMWILHKNPGLNLCGFVTEIMDFDYVEFHIHKAEIVVNFDDIYVCTSIRINPFKITIL